MLDFLQSLLLHYRYCALFFVLFLNNLGIPSPGTSILLGAGLFVGKGTLSIWLAFITATFACFLGSNVGYWLGLRFGQRIIQKMLWLRPTHRRFQHLEIFFKRYGPKGVFFARFVALLHPLIGIMAGVGKTPKVPFVLYNLAGSAVYSLLYLLAGNWLGTKWGLHQIWMVHICSYGVILLAVLIILNFFWRHSIHRFLGHVYFRKRSQPK